MFAYIFARLSWRPIFTSAIFRRGTVFTAICLCVCLLAVQLKRFWVDFYEIFVSGNRLDFGSDPKYILGILSYSQIVQSPVDWEDQLQCSAGNGWGGITVRIWVRRGGGMHFSECRLVLTVPKRASTSVDVRSVNGPLPLLGQTAWPMRWDFVYVQVVFIRIWINRFKNLTFYVIYGHSFYF